MEPLLAHLAGDYLLQTHHQATEKTNRWGPAVAHAVTYTAAHLPITRNWRALAAIGVTHAVIDHYRLARHVVWLKNQAAPRRYRPTLDEALNGAPGKPATGYPVDTPPWLSVWLMIAADNTLHLLINGWALRRWLR